MSLCLESIRALVDLLRSVLKKWCRIKFTNLYKDHNILQSLFFAPSSFSVCLCALGALYLHPYWRVSGYFLFHLYRYTSRVRSPWRCCFTTVWTCTFYISALLYFAQSPSWPIIKVQPTEETPVTKSPVYVWRHGRPGKYTSARYLEVKASSVWAYQSRVPVTSCWCTGNISIAPPV